MEGKKQTAEHLKKRILSGERHPNWKGGDITKESGRSRALRWFTARPCEKCGSEKSERHHVDENPKNNAIENIKFLCRSCHFSLHDFRTLGAIRHAE